MIPYSKSRLSDFPTISQTNLLENHTLHSNKYLYTVFDINRLLTEREGRTGEYWPEVVAVL